MNTSNTAFFSSARTSPDLKEQTEHILNQLGLSWSAFVNNAAKRLVREKKVEFSLRDEYGFTPEKSEELQEALADVCSGKNTTKAMKTDEAQKFLLAL